MKIKDDEILSAQVIVKSEKKTDSIDPNMLTSENIHLFLLSKESFENVQADFAKLGFEIQAPFGNSFSIIGSAKLFQEVFKAEFKQDEKGNIKSLSGKESASELPLENLSTQLKEDISAVTFTEVPDFGPTDF